MSFLDTLLVDGHDVRALTGVKVAAYINLFAPGDVRGDDDVIPGADGELGNELPLAKYIIHVPIKVLGASRGERNDNLRALGPLFRGTGGLVTLTRRIATGTGTSHVEHTAPGRYITGLSMAILNDQRGETELQFYNLHGAWYDGTNWLVP